jgi:CDP-glucose 4,6-dehydratase
VSVGEVIELARRAFGRGQVQYGDGTDGPYESAWLALDASKAHAALGVAPILSLARAVDQTMAWYRAQGQGADARQLCLADISEFEGLALTRPAAVSQTRSHAI